MTIKVDEITKYEFNPDNPRACKSYTLLLKLAKKNALTYVSPDLVCSAYRKVIDSNKFREDLWDMPDNYDLLTIDKKIKLYISNNSKKEFADYIDTLDVNKNNFIYNDIFNNFFDSTIDDYIKQMKYYDDNLLICKIADPKNCSFAKYLAYKSSYTFNKPYQGHKILFTNEKKFFHYSEYFFDVSTVFITTNKDLFIDAKKSAVVGKIIYREEINNNIKPLFLKDEKDIEVLLKTLKEDLKINNEESPKKEDISSIDTIKINNFYSINKLKLKNLKDKKEIYIVGENGDGKSLLLQAIATSLVGIKEGEVFDLLKTQSQSSLHVRDSLGINYEVKNELTYHHLIAYGASRYNNCQLKEDKTGYLNLFNNIYDLKSPIKWLQYLDYNEQSKKSNVISVADAKKLLKELLNSEVDIDITPDEVVFTERGSEVAFEQLSAGYRGIVTIICDLISRFYEKQPYIEQISDFKGIVLIDEIELHLHPKWKYRFMNKLRKTFPYIQFIVTTHSPTVILGASKEAVFYKIYKDNGSVNISNQIPNEGYTNNSLVSSPLFDMQTITSRDYNKKISSDDYIYEKIHQVVAKKIKKNIDISEDELLNIIDKELSKI